MVEVRASRIHGKGLFARRALPARRKIGELSGELISRREARRRAAAAGAGAGVIAIVEFDDGTALDAARSANPFRYVNHSCAPNAYIRLYRRRVEFYALREIAPGEELTCDYGETHHAGKLPCRCLDPSCRRML